MRLVLFVSILGAGISTLFLFLVLFSGNDWKKIPIPHQYGHTAQVDMTDVALFDFNGDGILDIASLSADSSPARLFLGSEGGGWQDYTEEAGFDMEGGNSIISADFDNNGHPDILVLSDTGDKVFLSDGSRFFRDFSLGSPDFPESSVSGAVCDFDNDGLLDLYLGKDTLQPHSKENKFYLNNGNWEGVFWQDKTEEVGLGYYLTKPVEAFQHGSWSVSCFDYDNDFDTDIFLGPDFAAISLLENQFSDSGNLFFINVSQEKGLDIVGNWMGIVPVDFNNDGYLDFFATNWGSSPEYETLHKVERLQNTLFVNNAGKRFEIFKDDVIDGTPFGWGAITFDFENDGDKDIYYVGNFLDIFREGDFSLYNLSVLDSPGTLLINKNGEFINETKKHNLFNYIDGNFGEGRGISAGDINNDGYMDFVVSNRLYFNKSLIKDSADFEGKLVKGSPLVFINPGGKNNWIKIKLIGTLSNRDAIGAKISITSESGVKQNWTISESTYSHLSREIIAGLGQEKSVREVLITWPSGVEQSVLNPEINERLVVTEPVK